MPYCALGPQLTSARRAGRRERRRGRGRGKWLQAGAAQTSPHSATSPASRATVDYSDEFACRRGTNNCSKFLRRHSDDGTELPSGPGRRRALLLPAPASPAAAAAASSSSAAAPASPAFPSLQLFPNSRRKIITHARSHGFDVEWPSECEAKQAGHADGWPAER
jgi:hypothetical protein